MIQPQELRIGNLLYVDGNIIKVGKIDENLISWNIAKDTAKFNIWNPFLPISDKRINSIPLTEEILLKFGFEFRNSNKHYGWYLSISQNRVLTWCHSKEISLEFDDEDYDYNNTLFDFNCEYVHQIQNIYFALTGKELTFKK